MFCSYWLQLYDIIHDVDIDIVHEIDNMITIRQSVPCFILLWMRGGKAVKFGKVGIFPEDVVRK